MKTNTSQDYKSKQLTEILKEKIVKIISKLNKARMQLMVMVVIALCKVQTVSFHKLASAFETYKSVESPLRRLQPFIADFKLDSNIIAPIFFDLLPEKINIKLVIVHSTWKFYK